MGIELRQNLKLTQQLIMTPQLQQAIKLLQLSRLELIDTIRQQLEENPLLEDAQDVVPEDQTDITSETASSEETLIPEVIVDEKNREDVDWSSYINEYNTPGKVSFEPEGKESPRYESFIAKKESLTDHLNWQLLMMPLSEEQKKIGSHIIGNLNKDGYLEISVDEIADLGGFKSKQIKSVLSVLQTFDPIGVCARDLTECLLIQAKHFGFENTFISEIIENYLPLLERKKYKTIAKALAIDIEEVISFVNVIKSFEPRPGRIFGDEEPQYINPDIFVYKLEDNFVIVLNEDGMPRLRVNSFYEDALRKDGTVSDMTKEYMHEKIRSASWLIKSIHQRQKTIYKVTESIVNFQRDFFEKGIEYLKPMVLRDVAEDIGMHESTISRVTTNKYAFTPQGILELKYFFNSSIKRVEGESVASASVMDRIKQMIENEDTNNPLSDDKIATILKGLNINIARRTVAKYREILRILPSSKRRQ